MADGGGLNASTSQPDARGLGAKAWARRVPRAAAMSGTRARRWGAISRTMRALFEAGEAAGGGPSDAAGSVLGNAVGLNHRRPVQLVALQARNLLPAPRHIGRDVHDRALIAALKLIHGQSGSQAAPSRVGGACRGSSAPVFAPARLVLFSCFPPGGRLFF
eukprot:scaffold4596_cov109-Isochrysis_galbana.AAC.4